MSKILTIDCDYLFPQFACSYLLQEGDEAAFIDTNTAHCVPRLLKALQVEGLHPSQVHWVIVTHAHLDHAGGAQALLEACPNARLVAHPKAAPHLMDPSKLIASAKGVYGVERFEALYGNFGPIPASRVQIPVDESELPFGKGNLKFLYTRGHAPHHFCIFWEKESAIFTGDAFGLCYPALQKGGLFIFPSTSPTGFEPEEALASVDRILKTGAKRAFLTHFGELLDLPKAAEQLRQDLTYLATVLAEAQASSLQGPELETRCFNKIQDYYQRRLAALGLTRDTHWDEVLALDLELNAQGIAGVAEKLRAKKVK